MNYMLVHTFIHRWSSSLWTIVVNVWTLKNYRVLEEYTEMVLDLLFRHLTGDVAE